MNVKLCLLVLLYSSLSYCKLWLPDRRAAKSIVMDGDAGEPLILTRLLEENKIAEAQKAAEVNNSIFGDIKSYSGYFTVDVKYDSNLFFWFFPAFEDYENAPVVLWLEGGPGASSLYGLFQQNGPFVLKSASEISFRETMWATTHSLLYIDNPAGTGFSFTNGGYASNQTKVGEDLYSAIQQFFAMFPQLRQNDFFVTGESYAGKYVPALGYQIFKRNSKVDDEHIINLQGLFIGNGLSDPERQLMYGDYLYQLGLIDYNAKVEFNKREDLLVKCIQEENYTAASGVVDTIDTLFVTETGFKNYYNLLIENDTHAAIQDEYMYEFLNTEDIRRSIHVGNVTFEDIHVYSTLKIDIPKSVTPWISELLSNYRILIYNGQLDLRVPYTPTIRYLENLDFSSTTDYKHASRYKWFVGDDLAGYVKVAGNLTEALVRNAGHMVPIEQPKWTLDLLTKFVRNQKIYTDE